MNNWIISKAILFGFLMLTPIILFGNLPLENPIDNCERFINGDYVSHTSSSSFLCGDGTTTVSITITFSNDMTGQTVSLNDGVGTLYNQSSVSGTDISYDISGLNQGCSSYIYTLGIDIGSASCPINNASAFSEDITVLPEQFTWAVSSNTPFSACSGDAGVIEIDLLAVDGTVCTSFTYDAPINETCAIVADGPFTITVADIESFLGIAAGSSGTCYVDINDDVNNMAPLEVYPAPPTSYNFIELVPSPACSGQANAVEIEMIAADGTVCTGVSIIRDASDNLACSISGFMTTITVAEIESLLGIPPGSCTGFVDIIVDEPTYEISPEAPTYSLIGVPPAVVCGYGDPMSDPPIFSVDIVSANFTVCEAIDVWATPNTTCDVFEDESVPFLYTVGDWVNLSGGNSACYPPPTFPLSDFWVMDIYPQTMSIDSFGSTECGDLVNEIFASDGTLCASQIKQCEADGDFMLYDFTVPANQYGSGLTFDTDQWPSACANSASDLTGFMSCLGCPQICSYEAIYGCFVNQCQDACIVCDPAELNISICTPTLATHSNVCQPIPLCNGTGVPTNMVWYAFYAGSDYIEYTITHDECLAGLGVQTGLFDACPCDGGQCIAGTGDQITTSYTVSYSNAVVGQPYWIYVDGFEGSQCYYTLQFASPPALQWSCPDEILVTQLFGGDLQNNGTLSFCPEDDFVSLLAEPLMDSEQLYTEVEYAEYFWSLTSSTTSELPFLNTSTNEPTIEFALPVGFFTFCFEDAINECDVAVNSCPNLPFCVDIQVLSDEVCNPPPPDPMALNCDSIHFVKNYGGAESDILSSLLETKDGDYLLGGSSSSTEFSLSGDSSVNFLVIKTDHEGDTIWTRNYGGDATDELHAMIETNDGGYLLAGHSNSSDIGLYGDYDFLVYKTDQNGDVEWMKNYGGTDSDKLTSLIKARDGSYLLGGRSNSSDQDVSNNYGKEDFLLIKIDFNGDIIWTKNYGGSEDDGINCIIEASDGSYLLGGYSNSDDIDILGNYGDKDFCLLKVDVNGDIIWSQNYGGSQLDELTSILENSFGGYYLGGNTFSDDVDISNHFGESDMVVMTTNASGNMTGSQNYGGSGIDGLTQIIRDRYESNIIVGYSSSSTNTNLENNGDLDQQFIRFGANGFQGTSYNFGGANADQLTQVLIDSEGNYVLAGHSSSDDEDFEDNFGAVDYTLVKLNACGDICGSSATVPNVNQCHNAPVLCNLSSFTSCTRPPEFHDDSCQPSPICMASGSPENISWYAFYAGSEFLEITCTVLDCKDIIGVQFGLYELCPCDGGGNCVAGTGNQITTSFTISYTSATIGQIYYLYVDGWAGAECEFEIEFDFATTIQWPCPDTIALSACADIPDAFLPNSFCFPSEEGLIEIEATIPNLVDFTNDTDFKSNTFHWTINSPTGNLLPFENTISTTEPKLEFTLSEPGYWELCLEDAINDCDTASDHCLDLPECIPINVVELANENFGPYEVCLSELEDGPGFNPGFWNGNVWQGPNLTADLLHDSEPFCVETGVCTFTHITTNACGCEVRQNAIINVIGLSDPVPYTVYLCEGDPPVIFDLGGIPMQFDAPTFDELIWISGIGPDGCPLPVLLSVLRLHLDGELDTLAMDCEKQILEFMPTAVMPQDLHPDNISYQWSDASGNTIGDDQEICITENGFYTLEVSYFIVNEPQFGEVFTCDPLVIPFEVELPNELVYYEDQDGDGFGDPNLPTTGDCTLTPGLSSNNEDCDDDDADIFPGALCNDGNICTTMDAYSDDCECIGVFQDTDGDGVCNAEDCEPGNPNVYPGAIELCDGIDNDCDGMIDEDLNFETYYVDADGDGFGDPDKPVMDCEGPAPGTVINSNDCDDADPNIYPKALCDDGDPCTVVDKYDDNCECIGRFQDTDGDGVCNAEDCKPGNSFVYAGAPCDDEDICTTGDKYNDDCDCIGDYEDSDGDGVCNAEDCQPGNPDVYPGAVEVCDGLDNDCDGSIDEDLNAQTYYADTDGDGYGDPNNPVVDCAGPPPGTVLNSNDCDDSDPNIYLNASCDDGDPCTVVDKFDINCDCIGRFQDTDEDGFCNAEDCRPGNPNFYPGSMSVIIEGPAAICHSNDCVQLNVQLGGTGVNSIGGWLSPLVDANHVFCPPNVTQTYQLIYEVNDGNCSERDSFEIQVFKSADINIFPTTQTICVDSELDISVVAPQAQIAFWECSGCDFIQGNAGSLDSVSISWDTPGTYPISATVFNGMCNGIAHDTIVVEAALERLSINCEPTTSMILVAWDSIPCASNYQIVLDGETVAMNYTETEYSIQNLSINQEVQIEIYAESECACPDSYTEVYCKTLKPYIDFEFQSSSENEKYFFNIYPNPTSSFINIEKELTGNFNYKIYNGGGIEMLSGEINEEAIDIKQMPEGFYLILIESLDGQFIEVKKLVKL